MILHPFEEIQIGVVGILEKRVLFIIGVLVVEGGEEIWELGHYVCSRAAMGASARQYQGEDNREKRSRRGPMDLQSTDIGAKSGIL